MSWERITEHRGDPLYLIPVESVDSERRPVTQLNWVGRGDRILIETRRTPHAEHFRSYTGVVLGITYPGEKKHGLLPTRTLHLATDRTTRECISAGEISKLVNIDMTLGQSGD